MFNQSEGLFAGRLLKSNFSLASNHLLLIIYRELIESFSVAYHSKVHTVPLDWLKNIMFYGSIDQLINDLKYYGLTVDHETKGVRFQRDSFQSSKATVISFSINN